LSCRIDTMSRSGAHGKDQKFVTFKLENATHCKLMYGAQPDIIFDGLNPISRRVFVKKYGLCNKG
jgi:hypothetical protein